VHVPCFARNNVKEVDMSDRSLIPDGMRAQLAAEAYQGITTFGRLPLVTEGEQLDAWRPDVAVVGAPWDGSTTNRPGARFGPRALRANSYIPGTYHLDLGIEIFDHLAAVDFGDALCTHGMWERSRHTIHDRVLAVASRGIMPVVLGGDHSITWPSVTAVADVIGHGRVGVIHFDAHADTAPDIDGNLASHGTPMRRLIESGAVAGHNFVQVGLRGYWPPPDVLEWMRDQRMRTHFMQEIWERGTREVLDRVIAEALDGPDAVYLSVDIDVLDPGFAPGTGTPEPGGLAPVDLLRMVRQIALDTHLVGMDVVEVAPPYDSADITINNAHRLIWEALAGMAVRRRDGRAEWQDPMQRQGELAVDPSPDS
jgi:agmatinase